MKKEKEVKIEDLARMVQNGFDGMDKKFEGVHKRLDKLETGQKEIIKKLDKKVDRFEFRELEHRVEDLELKASWGK